MDVIVILYDAVRECEYDYDLEELSDIYHPLEDLKNCEFLRKPVEEFDYKSVKVIVHFMKLRRLLIFVYSRISTIFLPTFNHIF